MSFRRRTYPEVVENVLTGLIGGVSAESHAYPPEGAKKAPYEHALEHPPVDTIISVYGVRNNRSVQFVKDKDYQLTNNKLVWLENANTPDLGSVFHVNYRSLGASSPFNDLQVGSVIRTLAESFSLELAGLYAQLEAVYNAGFIDTATGRSLDNVIALLGIDRIKAGRNVTKVKFTRSQGSVGDIFIPAGTRIANIDASIQYMTIGTVTLLDGQNSVQVSARDVNDNIEGLEANTLVLLTKPVAGIDSVTNPNASQVIEQDESDDELRARSKNFLHGSEKATIGAIKQAIVQQNVIADVVENDPEPGHISITIHSDNFTPEIETRLRAALRDVRPAGIKINFAQAAAPYAVDIDLRITTVDDLLEEDLRFIQEQATKQIQDYINGLAVGETISINRIVGLVLSNTSIVDVRLLSARVNMEEVMDRENGIINIANISAGDKVPVKAGVINIIDPALATVVTVKLTYPISSAPPSETQIKSALSAAVEVVNELNASEIPIGATPEQVRMRQIHYGKFLAVTPLPGKSATAGYLDVAGSEVSSLPVSADAGVYAIQYLITSESGISYLLDSELSPTVTLIPFERLTLSEVQIVAKREGAS